MSNQEQELSAGFAKTIKENAMLTIALGVLLILLGCTLLSAPVITGLSIASLVGFMVVIAGISQLAFAFKASQGLWSYVGGALTLLVGGYLVANPLLASGILTILLLIYFLASGVAEILLALQIKPTSGWGWTMVSGVLSFVLGIMIFGQFPFSGALAVGIVLGIKLLFSGVALAILGFAARSVAKDAAA